MLFDPEALAQKDIYKLLTGTIIPRPIGWISSISASGIPNLAPFSYFNAIGEDPPHIMFSTVSNKGMNKDTLNNVLQTREFVVNLVTEETVERMNRTAEMVSPEINEFELGGLTPMPSEKVRAPRVAESPVNLECKLVHHYELENHKFGGATMLVGKVVMFHIDESILSDNFHINLDAYRPVARLAGSNYARLGKIFQIKRL